MEARQGFDIGSARAFYEAYRDADVEPVADESFEDFCERVSGVEWVALYERDEPAGAVLFDGHNVHVSIMRSFRGRAAFTVLGILRAAVKIKGYLLAPVRAANKTACDVLERLQFILIEDRQEWRIYGLRSN